MVITIYSKLTNPPIRFPQKVIPNPTSRSTIEFSMGESLGWIAPVVLAGLCVLSVLWTLATAPGFNVRGKHVLLSGTTSTKGLSSLAQLVCVHVVSLSYCCLLFLCRYYCCCCCAGGTKGLGLAVAKKYACAGANLSLVGRSLERLESAKEEIQVRLLAHGLEYIFFNSNSLVLTDTCGKLVWMFFCCLNAYREPRVVEQRKRRQSLWLSAILGMRAPLSAQLRPQTPSTSARPTTSCTPPWCRSAALRGSRTRPSCSATWARPTTALSTCLRFVCLRAFSATCLFICFQKIICDSCFCTCQYALPAMIESKVRGRFVIVSSAGALTTSCGSSSFSGSLFALRGLADSLR